jgi:hypothetical protein
VYRLELEDNMPRGSITDQDREFVEVWEHVSDQTWVSRLDARGDDLTELITGQREFRITTEERMLTEDRIILDDNDPFKNGAFRPIVVPDSVTIQTNPNALSEDEIRRSWAPRSWPSRRTSSSSTRWRPSAGCWRSPRPWTS